MSVAFINVRQKYINDSLSQHLLPKKLCGVSFFINFFIYKNELKILFSEPNFVEKESIEYRDQINFL